MTTVLIADQHPIVIHGIKTILEEQPHLYKIIGTSSTFSDLEHKTQSLNPDLIIVDIILPETEGLTSIKKLRDLNESTTLLVYSQQPERIYAAGVLNAGANGYIMKNEPILTLKTAVKTALNDGLYISERLSNKLKRTKKSKKYSSTYRKLSNRELEVLDFLSKGYRNKDIANIMDINEKTVSTYKIRLFKKMEVDNLASLIKQAKLLQLAD